MMLLSFWQQWSSNHSASFCIIGRFQSVEEAQVAEVELRRGLMELVAWHQRPENLDQDGRPIIHDEDYQEPTPVEKALAAHYGVTWNEHALDWVTSPEQVPDAVIRLDEIVFVTSVNQTWRGPLPYDAIVAKLGGEAVAVGEGSRDYLCGAADVDCTLPPEEQAQAMLAELEHYFAPQDIYKRFKRRVPWKQYPDPAKTRMYVAKWDAEGKRIEEDFSYTLEDWIAADHWYEEIGREYRPDRQREASDEERRRTSLALRAAILDHDYRARAGTLIHEGSMLRLQDLQFGDTALAKGLTALLAYLERHGCTDMRYEIRPVPYTG